MMPLRLFRDRTFVTANLASLLMYSAAFGQLFLLAQLLQTGPGITYPVLLPTLVLMGAGLLLFWAPIANASLDAARRPTPWPRRRRMCCPRTPSSAVGDAQRYRPRAVGAARSGRAVMRRSMRCRR
jgi:hypothetical protein